MSGMEKLAWTEIAISSLASLLALAMIPWLGNGALGAFGLLGFLPCGMWFLRKRGTSVTTDERDHQNEQRAIFLGILAAWQLTFLTLMVLVLRAASLGSSIPVLWLNWLIWLQFAVCYFVKGCAFLAINRRQNRATAC